MKTVYIADTGVFIRAGGPDNRKYQRLRNAVRGANVSLLIPRRVFDELGGDPSDREYPSGRIPWGDGIEEGWIVVADELDHTDPTVSSVMDAARRFIANRSDRDEDDIEVTDTALVGLAAQLLESGEAASIVLLTTDKPAGSAAERILPAHGFTNQIEYRYVSADYLETVSADAFMDG